MPMLVDCSPAKIYLCIKVENFQRPYSMSRTHRLRENGQTNHPSGKKDFLMGCHQDQKLLKQKKLNNQSFLWVLTISFTNFQFQLLNLSVVCPLLASKTLKSFQHSFQDLTQLD